MSNVKIHEEVMLGNPQEWRLCFQWVTYHYQDKSQPESGYRFIWRQPNGNLQPFRGQARIPSARDMFELITKATEAGWFVAVESSATPLPTAEDSDSVWTADEMMMLAAEAAEALDEMDEIKP